MMILPTSRSETYNIALSAHQYLGPKDGTPLQGLIQVTNRQDYSSVKDPVFGRRIQGRVYHIYLRLKFNLLTEDSGCTHYKNNDDTKKYVWCIFDLQNRLLKFCGKARRGQKLNFVGASSSLDECCWD